MSETRKQRVQRRVVSIPSMLAATVVAVGGFPFLVAMAVALDVVRLRRRLPTLRVYLFLVQYLINDSVEILAAPILWAAAGFGRRLRSPASRARHERLQWWSLRTLAKRAEQLLGLSLEFDGETEATLLPAPVIVLSRHASLFDASLPALLYHGRCDLRGVVMAELLRDPGFDLIYGRLGSVFIPRDNGPEATSMVARMADDAAERTAFAIFPEGRLYRPELRERLLERLAITDPDRAERLSALEHVLPPRPGGTLALLDAVPDADVVLLDHRGLDAYASLRQMLARVPSDEAVGIRARRIPRAEIPSEPVDQAIWLDDLWLGLDREITARRLTR